MINNVRLKDGTISVGQTMIIDGQQRITALATALLGWKVVDKDYCEKIIKIAFNPITKEFKVLIMIPLIRLKFSIFHWFFFRYRPTFVSMSF